MFPSLLYFFILPSIFLLNFISHKLIIVHLPICPLPIYLFQISINADIFLFIYLPLWWFIYLSIFVTYKCWYISIYVCSSICLFDEDYPFTYLYIHLFQLPIYPDLFMFIYLLLCRCVPVCLFIYLSISVTYRYWYIYLHLSAFICIYLFQLPINVDEFICVSLPMRWIYLFTFLPISFTHKSRYNHV